MRKLVFLIILIVLSVAIGLNWERSSEDNKFFVKDSKNVLLRIALVSDSENENDLLAQTLSQAQGSGVNFVIGLGDWSSVGTIEELATTKRVFDDSGLIYYLTPGDHDLWDSRNRGLDATTNFRQVFAETSQTLNIEGIQFIILNNSDIYKGILPDDWSLVSSSLKEPARLRFVFSHKTPFHPQSSHVMGEDTEAVADQSVAYLKLLEQNNVEGFFSGDLHFFAQFNSPENNVKITTIGAVNESRNFQGPRFAIVTVFDDYTWEVEDVEIR